MATNNLVFESVRVAFEQHFISLEPISRKSKFMKVMWENPLNFIWRRLQKLKELFLNMQPMCGLHQFFSVLSYLD